MTTSTRFFVPFVSVVLFGCYQSIFLGSPDEPHENSVDTDSSLPPPLEDTGTVDEIPPDTAVSPPVDTDTVMGNDTETAIPRATDTTRFEETDEPMSSDSETVDSEPEQGQECGELLCDVHGFCDMSTGLATCRCQEGFDGNGLVCVDVNECELGIDDCDPTNGTCTNTSGGFVCGCKLGLRLQGDGVTCAEALRYVQVDAAAGHTCALDETGRGLCFGDNEDGQCDVPDEIFQQIAAGKKLSCGILHDRTVQCWGDLGEGVSMRPLTGTFQQISVGYRQVCGILSNGTIACGGEFAGNMADKIPTGKFKEVVVEDGAACAIGQNNIAVCWFSPSVTPLIPLQVQVKQLSVSYRNVCALNMNGTISCTNRDDSREQQVPSDTFSAVAAGEEFNCGLKKNGAVLCWGRELRDDMFSPEGTFTDVAVGNRHGCGILQDGALSCWGEGQSGESVAPGDTFLQISAGYHYLCGVRPDNSVACIGASGVYGDILLPSEKLIRQSATGLGAYGVLYEDGSAIVSPYNLGEEPRGKYTQIVAGHSCVCALSTEGTAACFGVDENRPVFTPDETFTYLAASEDWLCGIAAGGNPICRGYPDSSIPSFVLPPTTPEFTKIAVGAHHLCGITLAGGLSCVGDGSAEENIISPPDGEFIDVVAGTSHTCALRADRSAVCFGNEKVAAAVPGDHFLQITARGMFACGLHTDYTLSCWGEIVR